MRRSCHHVELNAYSSLNVFVCALDVTGAAEDAATDAAAAAADLLSARMTEAADAVCWGMLARTCMHTKCNTAT